MRRALLALAVLLACAPSAQAISATTLQGKLGSEMARAGAYSGAIVRDLDTGTVLFQSKPDVPRTPASVEKLYTTSAALVRFGPDATLQTNVEGQGFLDPDGVWRGNLYLRGGGDPTFSRADLGVLVAKLAAQGILRVDGSLLGDESRFDSLRGSYDTGGAYDRDIGGVLGALTLGRGFAKDGKPAAEAARQLAKALRQHGIRVDGQSATGTAPSGARVLATVDSPKMSDLVALTNVPSDNFMAETLLKQLGAQFGGAGTTAAGAGVTRDSVAALGAHPTIVDGSGLSRADRTSPRDVVQLLAQVHGEEIAGAFERSLPVVGRTGTVRKRMRGTVAQDRCKAKTGTLVGVSALAGMCQATGGHTVAFAFLMNRTGVARAHRVQDRMTVAVTRYDGA